MEKKTGMSGDHEVERRGRLLMERYQYEVGNASKKTVQKETRVTGDINVVAYTQPFSRIRNSWFMTLAKIIATEHDSLCGIQDIEHSTLYKVVFYGEKESPIRAVGRFNSAVEFIQAKAAEKRNDIRGLYPLSRAREKNTFLRDWEISYAIGFAEGYKARERKTEAESYQDKPEAYQIKPAARQEEKAGTVVSKTIRVRYRGSKWIEEAREEGYVAGKAFQA